jgi:integrase/recombinase XerD
MGRKGALSPEGLDRLLYRLRDQAGAEHFAGLSVAAHRWRHTHAVKSLEAGMDTFALSKQMGHSDIGVTTNYLKAVSSRQIRSMTISPLDQLGRA